VASTLTLNQTSLYFYGITQANDDETLRVGGVGGADVETVVECGLAAIVSRLNVRKVRPQRANLSAHHRILHEVAEGGPVLPAVFGTVAESEETLRRVLRRNHDALVESLDRLRGKVEMGLKVYWDLPNVFEYFVATHQELEAMRNRLFRPGRTATVEEKVELGERFVSLLQQARDRHTGLVKQALAPWCVEVRAIDPGEERMIMKLACLVAKDRERQWEDAVRQAALFFDDHYRFDFSGPWAPYNFAEVDLELT
jgi:hypothetical protein